MFSLLSLLLLLLLLSLLLEPFTFNSRLGFYFNVSQAWKGEVLGLSGVR